MERARVDGARFARQTYEASLGVRGGVESVAEIKAVDKAADRVDGRDVNLKVDSRGSARRSLIGLNGSLKGLASNLRAVRTLAIGGAIIAAPAAIGAATPAVLALSASVAGLAFNLSKAAAGFGLVGAAAGGGALVGLKAYGSLISSVISDSRTLWEKENDKAVKALEEQRLKILENAKGFDAWNKQINASLLGFTHLQAAVGSRVFPLLTRELHAWTGALKDMRPYIANTAGDIVEIAVGFSRWFRTADDGSVFGRTLGFISISAEKGARALSLIARIGISAFRPLIPLAYDLQQSIIGVLDATNRWVQSAEGQKRLGQIFRGLWQDAKRLLPVALNLAGAIGNIFSALDRTGVADQASRGFARLVRSLERGTRAGGGFYRFLRDARQLMPFVGGAVMDLVGAIGGIASAAIHAREHGQRLTILQGIFRAISNAAKPIQQTVVASFRHLGPAVADILPPLLRLFHTLTDATGPAIATFLRSVSGLVRAFNHLPAPVKKFLAQAAAMKVVLKTLGIGAVVAPMGRFASNMVIAQGAASRLAGKSALLGVAGALGRIGVLLGAGIGLAALAGTLYFVYKRNKLVRDSVDGLAAKLKDRLQPEIRRAQDLWKDFGKGVANRIDRLGRLIVEAFDLGTGGKRARIQKYGANAADNFARGVSGRAKGFDKDGGPGWEIGTAIGRGVGRGLHDYLVRRGGGSKSLSGLKAAQWVNLVTPGGMGAEVAKWVGRTFGPGIIHGLKQEISWGDIGRLFLRLVTNIVGLGGLSRVIGRQIDKNIGQPLRNKIPDLFKGLGKNAALGFAEGFENNLPGGRFVDAINKVREAVKKWQKEHSPSRLWMEQGKNAALGYTKGFRDNIGGITDEMRKRFRDWVAPGDDAGKYGFRRGSGVHLVRAGGQMYYTTGRTYGQPGDASGLIKYPVGYGPLGNMRADQIRRLSSGGGKSSGAGMGGASRPGHMTDGWRRSLRYMQRHPNNYDIGGDVDIKDTPRKVLEFLKRDGWFRRGGSLYHPDTPKSVFRGSRQGSARTKDGHLVPKSSYPRLGNKRNRNMVQAEDGTMVPRDFYKHTDYRPVKQAINKNEMREVMREHRHESGRNGAGGIDYERLAHAIVSAMQSGLPGFIDHSMGGYFAHRNGAGADPR